MYQRLSEEFEIGAIATFDEEENDILDSLSRSGVLPIDKNGFATIDAVIPEQVWEFLITKQKRALDLQQARLCVFI